MSKSLADMDGGRKRKTTRMEVDETVGHACGIDIMAADGESPDPWALP